MPVPDRLPGGMPVTEFLQTYWQKKPLFVREAFPGFRSPIAPEDLAGLALEEEADARLILERGGTRPWELRYGPFEASDFEALPERHWTLLVQEVDRWVPEIAELLERFLLVPGWRLDDVMVSYAPDGGSVGAHVDNYDVFLVQAYGKREWQIGAAPVNDEVLVEGIDVSILADFEPEERMTLGPGDMLYLPPRVAHHGVAVGDCMTFSVGFRAPSHKEILTAVLSDALEEIDPLLRYGDPDLARPDHPGRIDADALARVHRVFRETLSEELVARSFGRLVTESARGEVLYPAPEEWSGRDVAGALRAGDLLVRFAPNRIAFVEHEDGTASLFLHGEEFRLDADLAYAAPLIAGRDPLTADMLERELRDPSFLELLAHLVNDGHLEFVETE